MRPLPIASSLLAVALLSLSAWADPALGAARRVSYQPVKVFGDSRLLSVQSLGFECGAPVRLVGRLGNGVAAGPRRVVLREEGESIAESTAEVEIPQGGSAEFTLTSPLKADCSARAPRVTVKVVNGSRTVERWEASRSRVAARGEGR